MKGEWKQRLAYLLLTYQDVFSKDNLYCGEATPFVHRISLMSTLFGCPSDMSLSTLLLAERGLV